MQEHRRYRPRGTSARRAQVNTAPLPSQQAPRPGPVTDAEDEQLAALRRRVVEPVVTSVLHPREVEALGVHWGLDGRVGDVWVRIDVPDGRHEELLISPWWVPDPWDVDVPTSDVQIAAHLGDRLQDWVCETTFAWASSDTPATSSPRSKSKGAKSEFIAKSRVMRSPLMVGRDRCTTGCFYKDPPRSGSGVQVRGVEVPAAGTELVFDGGVQT